MKLSVTFLLLALAIQFLLAESPSKKSYTTAKISSGEVRVDGSLDEPAWNGVDWGGGDFIVRTPNEGAEPSEKTLFKILYDDKFLYIGVRNYDREPDKIARRMSRRDGFEGDWVEVNIDSYFDQQTAFSFTITAAGVKGDEFISNNGNNWDSNWDPIWFVETAVDSEGWIAEMKIPFSQIRFGNKEDQIWGIQFTRRYFQKNERSNWVPIPQNSNGWVHYFGELHGISDIHGGRQVELLPYSVGKQQSFAGEDDNPFSTGSKTDLSLGLDGKVGLTSNVTMDFTINPDFGQVEADPSEVNLTAFETFFSERRPFFIEGRNITDFQITQAAWGGSYSRDNLFYSRRIGRRPAYYPDLSDDEFAEIPVNSSILGAAKITGKSKGGWSVGIIESVTAEEKAEIDLGGTRRQEIVEPATNYLVGRVQKDSNEGKTIFGLMATSTNRRINTSTLNFLHKAAYTGGLDFEHNFADRNYFISGNAIFSRVSGDAEAIANTQLSSARYFQRSDANHLSFDSTRTSLSGTGGTLQFGKRGNFKYQTGLTWRSPGLELNDIGFLRRADEINEWTWVGYRITKPFSIFNNISLNANTKNTWDFDGVRLESLLNTNGHINFKNEMGLGGSITYNFDQRSNSELRGGPSLKVPGNTNFNMYAYSDNRKSWQVQFGTNQTWGFEDSYRDWNVYIWSSLRATTNLSASINPFYSVRRDDLQYIDSIEDQYYFGRIDQETAGITLRINYSLTPDLSVEYYGSPFVSAGSYDQFKKITDPNAGSFRDRFAMFSDQDIQYDADNEEYLIDEDGDGSGDVVLYKPDFNFRDFNSNLVVRWEYSAGSTLFLVWSQGRNSFVSDGRFSFGNDLQDLFREEAHDIFLIKFNRWFSL